MQLPRQVGGKLADKSCHVKGRQTFLTFDTTATKGHEICYNWDATSEAMRRCIFLL